MLRVLQGRQGFMGLTVCGIFTRQLDLGQPAAVDSQLRETAATGIERAVDSMILTACCSW